MSDKARPFPWAEAMAIGLGVLRLPPPDFWAMTPVEFGRAVSGLMGGADGAPMSRSSLDMLMARFPDGDSHG
jgi:uncharacterized phage protein (TIGR02216 family)